MTNTRRTFSRTILAGFALIAMLATSGCAVVDAYSDSILADTPTWSSGEVTRAHINDSNAGISTRNWTAEPMHAMAGPILPSFFAGKPLATGANAIVISFGTNDASNAASGAAGAYSEGAAQFYALDWIQRARASGATCVVWVLGNPSAYRDRTWAAAYTGYLTAFNNWLVGLGSSTLTPSGTVQLRIVDWGAMARVNGGVLSRDGIHPNASGAAFLGEDIKAKVKSC